MAALAVQFETIPGALTGLAQWVVWRLEEREGKVTKVPYQVSGRLAQANTAATWTTFAAARAAYAGGGYSGVGFVVSAADGFVGVDLDHVIDTETGEVAAWANDIITRLDSYTERTPSGDGLRVWILADDTSFLSRKRREMGDGQQLEVYGLGRYFTVTGLRWGEQTAIAERTEALREVYRLYLAREETAAAPAREATPLDMSDAELLTKIRGSRNGAQFDALWHCKDGQNRSEGDLALCGMLAFWTGGDRGRMDGLFRASARMREKWDKRHDSGGRSYGEMTIDKALSGRQEFYCPKTMTARAVAEPEEMAPPAEDVGGGREARAGVEGTDGKNGRDGSHGTDEEHKEETLANNLTTWEKTDKGEKPRYHARRSAAIMEDIRALSGGWPKVCDGMLFAPREERPSWLPKPSGLFAWLQQFAPLSWREGNDAENLSFVTQEQMHAYLTQFGEHFTSVESYPHEPEMSRHCYLWEPDAEYTPDGRYLEGLLAFFDNAETLYDTHLIKAMFLTPAWGGPYGRRPAFAITAPDSGCGKSTLADMVGRLYGGRIDAFLSGKGSDDLISRLLTPEERSKRVVRADNMKGEVGDPTIEALITSEVISGRQLYKGEGQRPNTLTWIITGNGLRLSRDIASRCFVINLVRPTTYRPNWESTVISYIEANRRRILMDIVALLREPAPQVYADDRWAEWVSGVLSHCTTATYPLLQNNLDRRQGHDSDAEEAMMIFEALNNLPHERIQDYKDGWMFVPHNVVLSTVCDALRIPHSSAKAVNGMVRRHIVSGRFKGRLVEARSKRIRGIAFLPETDNEE